MARSHQDPPAAGNNQLDQESEHDSQPPRTASSSPPLPPPASAAPTASPEFRLASRGQLVGRIDQSLLDAAKYGNVARIQNLVEEDGNILLRVTPDGNIGLHLVVRFRWSKFEKVFQLCPLDILTQCNAQGQTVLHLAVLSRNLKAITTIRSKVVVDVEDGRQETMMQMVRAADSNGDMALHLALRNKFEDVANKLMELDGPGLSNLVNKRGESPLYLYALGGLSTIVECPLEFAPTNYRGPPPNNPTTLHVALLRCSEGSVRGLLRKMPCLDRD